MILRSPRTVNDESWGHPWCECTGSQTTPLQFIDCHCGHAWVAAVRLVCLQPCPGSMFLLPNNIQIIFKTCIHSSLCITERLLSMPQGWLFPLIIYTCFHQRDKLYRSQVQPWPKRTINHVLSPFVVSLMEWGQNLWGSSCKWGCTVGMSIIVVNNDLLWSNANLMRVKYACVMNE